ncbi:MAG: ATP-dependent DNA helicase RecG [Bacteroidales bacterium]|nr:ATP-dependent DNA helicase RecG [Bacteroidales bacterium]
MINLNTDIQYLKGVGEARAKVLKKDLDIYTVEDLLYFFPYKHIDKSKIYLISDIHSQIGSIQLQGRVSRIETIGQGRGQRLSARFTDRTGSIELVWFKGIRFLKSSLKEGEHYTLFGKPILFNGRFSISHPEMEKTAADAVIEKGLMPQYSIPEKVKDKFVNSKLITKLVEIVWQLQPQIPDPLPSYLKQEQNIIDLCDALKHIHKPQSEDWYKKAEERLKFDELFNIQLKLLFQKHIQKSTIKGHIFGHVGQYFNRFFKELLEFELTEAQKRVVREIHSDVKSGLQMNRLIQGDVGSGKTIVAFFAMLMAVDNGFQAAMMAPTEILANQHFEGLKPFADALGLKIYLLTGNTKKSEREQLHQDLQNGVAHLLIGTHALIEDTVQFDNLGIVVIDEQHRFGVAQRAKFWNKNNVPPHILIMTATPIPRTLSMTIYGDLDVSVIDELPPGRKTIQTQHLYDTQFLKVYKFIRDQIALGRQIYVVYPLIKESEKLDFKALEEGFWQLYENFPPPKYHISKVHGDLKAKDKAFEMQQFVKGETHIMVATTVIEVGVNVPNASVMIIESAERFGLSQLHQLRGRVGRGADQSYCILKTSHKLSKESRTRIEAMVNSNDGFELAEIDMQLRGPGSIDGTQQSGMPFDFKIAKLTSDQDILQKARKAAEKLLSKDPDLNALLKQWLKKQLQTTIDWSRIG